MREVFFYISAGIAVISAIMMIVSRKIIYSALSLLIVMIAQSFMFFALNATYLGVIQMIVYAGGVIVLFIFVISLVGSGMELSFPVIKWWNVLGVIISFILGGVVCVKIVGWITPTGFPIMKGTAKHLAYPLLIRNALSFEIITFILITALIGAIYFGRKGNG